MQFSNPGIFYGNKPRSLSEFINVEKSLRGVENMSITASSMSGVTKVLKFGMVGGGQGAFIGDVDRKGASLDALAALTAGCFSRNYDNTLTTGALWNIAADRLYRTYEEMAQKEAERKDGIDFVIIVTPNNTHYPVAKAFLEKGIHVVCDKPLALTSKQGEELKDLAEKKGLLFCVTYIYTGYPMVRQMREMIQNGDIGAIRVVTGRYIQGWLATELEAEGQKQASWRCDPAQSGISNATGDIGTHLENLIAYTTGLKIQSLCANLRPVGEYRKLDNEAEVLVRYEGGATGMMWASQVAIGRDNDLRIMVCGEKGTIEWEQENPNYLRVDMLGEPTRFMSRGNGYFYPAVNAMNRIPSGHVE
ncbi:MAG: Gfo/Idh/MocA family oxidoreductase, partial [Firmicutes bacterium]|nr:Gfo/Idh/MocA family oxidoreductase [Bacillota bacterium]